MKLYKLSTKGFFHENHNEDYLISAKIGDNKLLISVLDGCSNGIESYFASTLIGKLLKKIAKELDYLEFIKRDEKPLEEILKETVRLLFGNLREVKSQLDLNKYELLSTMILGVIDSKSKIAELLIVGDGLINYNGIIEEFEQDNQPDYLGYHLQEDFEEWYENQNQRLSLKNISDLSISTDGIYTFKEYKLEKGKSKSELEILEYLLRKENDLENENMLSIRLHEIQENWNLKPSDDLSVIRVLFL